MKPIPFSYNPSWPVPNQEECEKLWAKFNMPGHIREHSYLVGLIARCIARWAQEKGWSINVDAVYAAGLLHDLGKAYCIKHGGAHSQLGGSLVMEHTGNPAIAQGVMHHVFWPGEINIKQFFLPLVIIYSDKRVKHTKIVSIEERFEDLFQRYGTNTQKRKLIQKSKDQVQAIASNFSQILGVDLNACPFDRRRLV
ncbi:HD domain-containing protein [Desulfovulcanus sp.]